MFFFVLVLNLFDLQQFFARTVMIRFEKSFRIVGALLVA